MVHTESDCAKGLKVNHKDTCAGRETDLDVESEQSPVLDGDGVGLMRHTYSRTGPSTEYARDGRIPSFFGPPAPRRPFRSPNSLKRFQKEGECTSSCNTAFAKHILRADIHESTSTSARQTPAMRFRQMDGWMSGC